MGGQLTVGLDGDAISVLAQAKHVSDPSNRSMSLLHDHQVRKTSRRDVALVCSQGGTGATTVSGTMLAAHMAGISTFVTGGCRSACSTNHSL